MCRFDAFERDDGIHPYSGHDPNPRYNDRLRAEGLGGENPWEEWANAAAGQGGDLLSGWFLKYANRPARVPDAKAETPYITDRAMDFLSERHDQPWLAHVSYIKPHWPYIAPEPYASMYGSEHVLPPVRSEAERQDPHPVYGAMQQHRVSRAFARDEVRDTVIPAYMGLIKQIDDQMGRLFAHLEATGQADDTMIVFTSDHGDYLGDHWMGEKDLFHEQAVRVPLIIYDPDPRADATRGSVNTELVELIDLLPTFLDVHETPQQPHVLDGRSLRPALFGTAPVGRDYVVSEYDYSFQDSRIALNKPARECWLRMIFDGRWKYVLAEGFRPMLFDLETDPDELCDLGGLSGYDEVKSRLHEALFKWARQPRQRATVPDGTIEATFVQERIGEGGILIGYWDEDELRRAIRDEWHPRFAAHNPIIRPTLERLLRTNEVPVESEEK